MTDTSLLIIGAAFTPEERSRLETAHAALFAASFAEVAALDSATRASVKAVAFKGHDAFSGANMDLVPNLGLIANFGVGYDAIDVDAADARGIKVTNTPDVLNDDVADLTVGMMLAYSRNLVAGHQWVMDGTWATGKALPLNRKMSGDTVGIVGMGRIGRDIADRLAAFKMDIHYHARSKKQTPDWTYHADVVDMAKAVDWLVIAIVGGEATRNYVGKDVLAALGPRGVVVNISRGTTVDEAALLDALEAKTIEGAALDVFLDEPTIDPRFLKLDNVHLQPHQGSGTVETRRAMAELQLANITAFLGGEALVTPVN
ncbi:2-hydroxyacid dehydrogenase [Celeribacter marinus]|uniref:2-hydroxyacid dehydrogenase n=1 Tax=Celeribacter marinus TaxID=1397108 RepID=UPI003181F42B